MVNLANTTFDFTPGNGTAATERTITIPATVSGDIVFVVMIMLNNTVTHTLSSAQTFDGPTVNTRTGISSALWTKKMTANTAAFDVTVTSTMSLGSVLSYLVLSAGLNGGTVGNIATVNQASGSNNLNMPAFTASAGTYAVDVVCVGASSDVTASLTPPSNIDVAGQSMPMVVGRRSGVLYGLSDPGESVGAVYVNEPTPTTSTHYAATYRVTMSTTGAVSTPPVATIGAGTPTTATQNDVVPLRGTVTDSDGTATGAWTITSYPNTLSAAPAVTNPGSMTAASFVPLVAGTYVARLTATDNTGATHAATRAITVSLASNSGPATEITTRLTWNGNVWA